MSLISIKNLTMDYGDGIVFKDVSFDVAKGEAVFIIGGSGCGKSTLLRCINRLITPVSGEVYINGEDILKADSDIDRIRRSMGMVYQSFNLFTHRKPQTKRFLYHSRMFEKHIDASSMDLYDLAGEMRRFLARFQFDSEHEKLISVVVDELLNPVFHSKENTPKSADIRLIESETGRNHSLFISFPEIVTDPLDVLFIDELYLKLLEHQIPIIMSKKQGEHSYEVYIQF